MTFDQLLVMHASETLAGMKCASLICLKNLEGDLKATESKLYSRGIRFLRITGKSRCPLMLVYRTEKLERALMDKTAEWILHQKGYQGDLSQKLMHLKTRFMEVPCPHEVGLFLGYPSRDVLLFILNGGRHSICTGHWKVYHNEHQAKKAFRKFDKCRKVYCSMLENGAEISRLCVTTA